jgi:branched-chain amino acid transport system ATP-binding protein
MDLHDPHGQQGGVPIRLSRDGDRSRFPARSSSFAERTAHGAEIRERLDALAGDQPLLRVDGLVAGYGSTEILHGIDLRLAAGQTLCLIGPDGGGKSTVLHSIFGLTDISRGRIDVGGRNVTRLGPNAKRRDAGIACVLQGSSLFPDLTVEQNLWLGGTLTTQGADARRATERVFDCYPSLAGRRNEPAHLLSAGECRLLEISRALVMRPRLLLVDRPSIGLEPACVEQIFGMLRDLCDHERLSIVMVEQNVRKGLEQADIGCVMFAGEMAMVGTGAELLEDPAVGQLFLGG